MIDEPEAEGRHDPRIGPADDRGESLRRAATIVAIVGLAFSVLFIVSVVVMLQVPGATAPDREIEAFYAGPSASLPVIVGLYLMPFAGIAFIWFIVAVRMWTAAAAVSPPTILRSNLQLVSGIAFVILFFIAAAASTVVAGAAQLEGSVSDPTAARQFPLFGRAVILFFAVKMAAMYVFTTSLIGRGPGALPDWFVFSGFAVGLFLLVSPVFSPVLVLAFPVWILVLCWIIFRAARRIPPQLRLGDLSGRPGTIGTGGRRAPAPIGTADDDGTTPGPRA